MQEVTHDLEEASYEKISTYQYDDLAACLLSSVFCLCGGDRTLCRMCDDLVLFSGVYDSQLMAAAGTDTVPTQEQLVAAIGTTFTDPVMISTTTDPEVACGFSDTLFVIYASQAAMEDLGAISIDSFLHTSENEILMCANASYRLLDVGTMAVEGLDEEEQPRTYYRNYVTVELLGAGE